MEQKSHLVMKISFGRGVSLNRVFSIVKEKPFVEIILSYCHLSFLNLSIKSLIVYTNLPSFYIV